MLMASICTFASDFESDGIHYNILSEENRTVEVAKNPDTSYDGEIEIPASVIYDNKTYNVTAIGEGAFSYCLGLTSVTIPNSVTIIGNDAFRNCVGLTSVTIPNSVTTIDSSAFYYCLGLTSVTIPNSVTIIGDWAFCQCVGLTSVTFPNSVTTIGEYAFNGCKGLSSVTIPHSVTTIGDYAFYMCNGLTDILVDGNNQNYSSIDGILYNKDATALITCPIKKESVTIPNSVTTIESCAFLGCIGLTSVTISNSVTTIGDFAFSGSGLTSVSIPGSVTTIGVNAFSGCNGLTNILVDGNNQNYSSIDGILYNKDATVLISCPGKKESVDIPNSVTIIGEFAFSDCGNLTSVTIPNSVTAIGYGALEHCSSLTSVIIGNSVTTIGDCAFFNCTGLTSVTIPNSVTTIGVSAFYNCSGLTSVTIGNSVTTIGGSAFFSSYSLTTVFCQAITPPTTNSNNVFPGIAQENCTLYVPMGCKADYEGVIPWCNFLKIEEMDFSGIDEATTEANATMRLSVENGTITVSGLSEQEHIRVYDAQGRMIYSGTERAITNLPHGLYIVKAGSSTAKAAI